MSYSPRVCPKCGISTTRLVTHIAEKHPKKSPRPGAAERVKAQGAMRLRRTIGGRR